MTRLDLDTIRERGGVRLCRECVLDNHDGCDSRDAWGNFDYCGPRPICGCFEHDPEGHETGTVGQDVIENVVLACWPCNQSKGNRLLGQWKGRP